MLIYFLINFAVSKDFRVTIANPDAAGRDMQVYVVTSTSLTSKTDMTSKTTYMNGVAFQPLPFDNPLPPIWYAFHSGELVIPKSSIVFVAVHDQNNVCSKQT